MIDWSPLTWAPESCALPTLERPLREAEFATFFRDHLRRVRRPGSTVVEFELERGSFERARELAALETSCCSFFSFDVRERESDGRVLMTIGVSPAQVPILEALVDSAVAASGAEVVA